jgi:cytoskeletal protein CcmA (bactofilin family)
MKRFFTAAGAAALIVSLSACVQAQTPERTSFDGLMGSQSLDTDGDVEMNGLAVSLDGRVGGNAVMNGAALDINARIGGNLEANGGAADIQGSVGGRTLVNAGAAELTGSFSGPVEINAGAAELSGAFLQGFDATVGALEFSGEAGGPVRIIGSGRERGMFRRRDGDRSRVEISGDLRAGGTVCAHEVRFTGDARVGGPLTVEADSHPDYPAGFDATNISFTPRQGQCG